MGEKKIEDQEGRWKGQSHERMQKISSYYKCKKFKYVDVIEAASTKYCKQKT